MDPYGDGGTVEADFSDGEGCGRCHGRRFPCVLTNIPVSMRRISMPSTLFAKIAKMQWINRRKRRQRT